MFFRLGDFFEKLEKPQEFYILMNKLARGGGTDDAEPGYQASGSVLAMMSLNRLHCECGFGCSLTQLGLPGTDQSLPFQSGEP